MTKLNVSWVTTGAVVVVGWVTGAVVVVGWVTGAVVDVGETAGEGVPLAGLLVLGTTGLLVVGAAGLLVEGGIGATGLSVTGLGVGRGVGLRRLLQSSSFPARSQQKSCLSK